MISYKLLTHNTLPRSFYRTFNNRNIVRTVKKDGTLTVDNYIFYFADNTLPPGTKVSIKFGHDFYFPDDFNCSSIEETKKRDELRHQAYEEEEKQYKEMLNENRKKAEEFNKTISLPVKWTVRIKGERKKNSVFHICLEENFDGLPKGSLLCNTPFEYLKEVFDKDANGDTYVPKVSCKKCLHAYLSMKKTTSVIE